jgi:membrane protein implicated in regulation of membrane protease activity
MNGPVAFWHWWALGALLLSVELAVPGAFFVWLASGAFATGAALWAAPGLSLGMQLLLFSALSLASIAAFRRYLGHHPIATDRPLLNRRSAQYIGRVFTLEQPIVDGRGKVRVDDSTWRVEGGDYASGAKVRVVAAEGVILKVERISEEEASEQPSH